MKAINTTLDIVLINKYVQFTIPEEEFGDWVHTFYPMLKWENETTEEMVQKIIPYWDSVCLSYSTPPPDESFELKYGKLDRGIQIYPRFHHI